MSQEVKGGMGNGYSGTFSENLAIVEILGHI